jgi:hypothetical protein
MPVLPGGPRGRAAPAHQGRGAHGEVGDEDILHIVEVTAIFNYNVRLATATGLVPNVEHHDLGRTSAA